MHGLPLQRKTIRRWYNPPADTFKIITTALYYNVILRRVRVTTVVVENIIYSKCAFVALVTQHAKSIGRVIQDDSVARGPKLLSIKNYVIEIMT
jgi:hypothetical protein